MTDKQKLDEVYAFMKSMQRQNTIPLAVERGLKYRLERFFRTPDGLRNAPLASIGNPSGGLTQDNEARTAVTSVITRLEALGLIVPN